jgi:hypothetical protein
MEEFEITILGGSQAGIPLTEGVGEPKKSLD